MLRATTQMRQLEVGVAVDETREELSIWEVERLRAQRPGYLDVWSHRGDPAGRINKNGAVLEGRRRDRVHSTSANSEQGLRA